VLLGTLTLAGAGPAGVARAQAPPPPPAPDERAAAREFSFAAYRLRLALLGQEAQLEDRMQAGLDAIGSSRCEATLVALVALPLQRREEAFPIAAAVAIAPAFATMRPAFERFRDELERVPTADPVLRSGRAAWRSSVANIATFPPDLDICGTLERWRRAGFSRAAAPLGLGGERLGPYAASAAKKLVAAARRMRELGVSAGASRRFSGETLLEGIGDDLDTGGS
jgi:hypothetical protein